MRKCTGMDMWQWGPGALFDIVCPNCGRSVEFFKDELTRACPGCRQTVKNQRGDYGCGQWCSSQSSHMRNYCSKFKRKKARLYGRY